MTRTMNRFAMSLALSDAEVAISDLRREIKEGQHDSDGCMALGVPFQYVLWQLCIAWHSRWLTDDELNKMSQAENDLLRDSIPNWGLSFQLVDIDQPDMFNPRDAPA